VTATATNSATASTADDRHLDADRHRVDHRTIFVEAIASTASITHDHTGDDPAVSSLGAMLNNGIRHWLAIALLIAMNPVIR